MEIIKRAIAEGRKPDLQALVDAIPYCRFLGIEIDRKGNELTTILRFDKKLIGNPILPALHGGVVGAFLEVTAVIQLMLEAETEDLPKPVDIGIDYLRSGRPVDAYARATITKHGRRVCNVRAEAWQDERSRPIAALHGHFLIKPKDSDPT
ncbi:MAG: PaaI family thioesterase [Alphaproteobacteria bacterium]|nr:PaaI family thioesterase [Alphaproteobacteria bacterium]